MSESINPYWLIVGSGAIAFIPFFVGIATSYVKMSIVFGMIRSALGAQNVPSGLIVTALSLTMTIYVMGPVIEISVERASALRSSDLKREPIKSLTPLVQPWRKFLSDHAGPRELQMLVALRSGGSSSSSISPDEVSIAVLLPAFLLSELKAAFSMAFVVLLPFLVIDLVVSNILVGLGMYMVSPVMISLPLKLLLFVTSDAWLLIVKGLIESYKV